MLSYKEFKQINESVMGARTLGLAQPQSLGIITDIPTEEELLAEMKKKMAATKAKMKKKMFGDVDPEGGEMVKKAEPKDGDIDAEKDAAKDSEDSEEKVDKKPAVKPEEDEDQDDDKGDDDDKGSNDDEDDEDDEDVDAKDDKEEPEAKEDAGDAKEMFMKKGGKGKKNKNMKKEDQEFWTSIQNMIGVPVTKSWDGWTPITNIEQAIRPGDTGSAPQTRIGG
jgi:hypothetical protein